MITFNRLCSTEPQQLVIVLALSLRSVLKDLRLKDDAYGMRRDVLVSTLKACLNVDVVITHPATGILRGRASRTPGAAARVAEDKRRSHAAGGAMGYRFVSFAIETYGRLGRADVELLG